MNFQEYDSVKTMTYDEYCSYLQNKYGLSSCNYTFNGGKDKRSNNGLELHHIREDIVPALSNRTVAESNPIEYQQPQNLCYCDYLEHMLLHIMIFEEDLEKNSDMDIMGILGVINHMVERLNDFYCKDLVGYKEYELNAYHKVKDDVDVYLKIIERIFNSTPKNLYSGICDHLCVSKNNSEDCQELRSNLYNDIKELSSVVQEHNKEFAIKIDEAITKNNRCLFVLGTSLGKTTTGLDYLIKHGTRGLVVHHQNNIRDVWSKNNDLVDTVSIQTLYRDYFSYDFSKYGLIIFDEAHHLSAPEWGKPLKFCIDNNIPVLGLTATPKKEVEELFGKDNVVYGYDVFEGIEKGILHPVSYVGALYALPDKIEHAKKHPEELTPILKGKLDVALNNTPTVAEILYRNMPSDNRKGIIFAQDISDMDDAIDIVKNVFPDYTYKVISSHETEEHNRSVKEWFEETDCGFLCSVEMISEGSHFNGVNTLIMLRKTKSRIKFEQQLGRVMVQTKYPDPNCIVFDLVNNALTTELFTEKLRKAIEGRGDVTVLHPGDDVVKDPNKKYIIVEDYTKPLVELNKKLNGFWTEEENLLIHAYIKKNGGKLQVGDISKLATMLGVTVTALRNHLQFLGYKNLFQMKIDWSQLDPMIINLHENGCTFMQIYNEISSTTHMSIRALQRRMKTLHINYLRKNKQYTEDMDNYIKQHLYIDRSVQDIAIDLKRSEQSVLARASYLKIKKRGNYSENEVKFIFDNYSRMGAKYCAEKTSLPIDTVYVIARKYNLVGMECKRKVQCVETGDIFNSVKEAAIFAKTYSANIVDCCKNTHHSTKGYHWKYVEDDDDSIV